MTDIDEAVVVVQDNLCMLINMPTMFLAGANIHRMLLVLSPWPVTDEVETSLEMP